MADEALTEQEEFFKALNLISTKKVKVKYCRTIKERLRPSAQQESLALPKKPKALPPSTPDKKPEADEEGLKLRGGFSLLKSLKRRRHRGGGPAAAASGPPSSRSLLSYLQHRLPDTLGEDSSSVESEMEDAAAAASGFRMKKVSVDMRRMRRERWSLESGGSSGDEAGQRLTQGFSGPVGQERGVRSKQAVYRRLIQGLERQLEEDGVQEDRVQEDGVQEDVVQEDGVQEDGVQEDVVQEDGVQEDGVQEDGANLVMQMVEDFSLESESEDGEVEEGGEDLAREVTDTTTESGEEVSKIAEDSNESQDVDIEAANSMEMEESAPKTFIAHVKLGEEVSGIAEDTDGRKEIKANATEIEEILEDPSGAQETNEAQSDEDLSETPQVTNEKENEESKTSFLDTLNLQSISEVRSSDSSRPSVTRRTLIQYHQVLKELELRTPPKQAPRRKARGLRDYIHTEDFGSDELNKLVERMRRESRGAARGRAAVVFPRRTEQRIRLLERRCYLRALSWEENRGAAYGAVLREGGGGGGRMERPTREEEERAREVAGVPGELYTALPRREARTPRIGGRPGLESVIEGGREEGEIMEVELTELPEKTEESVDSVDELLGGSVDELDTTVEFEIENPVDVNELLQSSVEDLDCITSVDDDDRPMVAGVAPIPTVDVAVTTEVGEESIEEAVEEVSKDQEMEELEHSSEILNNKFDIEEVPSVDMSEDNDVFEEEVEIKVERGDLAGKRFQCTECGKELNTKNGLDYHMRTHSGLSPFQCDLCFKKFKSSSLCSRHRQIHSIEKKYSCDTCSKSFAQKSNLSKHMDIHAGLRPFQVFRILKLVN